MTKLVNFYPGPSKIDENAGLYYQQGFASGIFEMNHRSAAFEALLASLKQNLSAKLEIPEGYEIILSSSATECWEMIAQSIVGNASLHLYNGAFGKKWFEYTHKITNSATGIDYGTNQLPQVEKLKLNKQTDTICITHNETSNGTCVPEPIIQSIKEKYPDCIVAIDATSSLGGQQLSIEIADIWYASVQKCLGLPPGLAVMILSPQAIERIQEKNENDHYNSLNFVLNNFIKHQTPYTPNIPNIYLLNEVMKSRPGLKQIDQIAQSRYEALSHHFCDTLKLSTVSNLKENQSRTVLALYDTEAQISKIKKQALAQNILLGNGYGTLKKNSFRIANFPALSASEIELLIQKTSI